MPTCTKSVCVHMHGQTQAYLKSKYYGVSVVQTPAKIFIQNCFMAHCCVCIHLYTYTHIHMCFTKAWIDSGQRKLMWMKNFHLERPFWMAFCYFTKARFGIFFFFFLLISECFHFYYFLHQNLNNPYRNGRTGIFCNLKLGNHFH